LTMHARLVDPKSDANAPEKPPSAYVVFANSVREELKGKSFTEVNAGSYTGVLSDVL
jgi:hypothetical protein